MSASNCASVAPSISLFEGCHDETGSHSRRADVVVARQTERAGLDGDARWRHGFRLRAAAVRSRYRRTLHWSDRAPDRTRPRAIETMPGDRGHVAAECHEVQR